MPPQGKTIQDTWKLDARAATQSLRGLRAGYEGTSRATDRATAAQGRNQTSLVTLVGSLVGFRAALAGVQAGLNSYGSVMRARFDETEKFIEAFKDLKQVTEVPRAQVITDIRTRGLFGLEAETNIFQAIASGISDPGKQVRGLQATRDLIATNTGLLSQAQAVAQSVGKVTTSLGIQPEEAARLIRGGAAASPANVRQLLPVFARVAAAAGAGDIEGNVAFGLLARAATVTGQPEEAGTLTTNLLARLVTAPDPRVRRLRRQLGVQPEAGAQEVLTGLQNITIAQLGEVGFRPTFAGPIASILQQPQELIGRIRAVRRARGVRETFQEEFRTNREFREQQIRRQLETQAQAARFDPEALERATGLAAVDAALAQNPRAQALLESLPDFFLNTAKEIGLAFDFTRGREERAARNLENNTEAVERNGGGQSLPGTP